MNIQRIYTIYFSPTGTTKKVVSQLGHTLAQILKLSVSEFDFTLPQARESRFPVLTPEDVVIFGCPTYAGRLPNLLLKYLDTIGGGGSLAIPVVTYGNRCFDNSLMELRDILETHDFHTVAAVAASCEHSFSQVLGAGRPDQEDTKALDDFARQIGAKLTQQTATPPPIQVPGVPMEQSYGGYYQPRDRHGVFIDIRKVKPKTHTELCLGSLESACGICAAVCPMGAIDGRDITQVPGICIKCGACIKKCPTHAKYYDDPGYLYHKTELEEMYQRRGKNHIFL